MATHLVQDPKMSTPLVEASYGEYVGTFHSEKSEVRADLFRVANELIAHVSFREGLSGSTVTDRWVSFLNQIAAERHMAGHLRLIYS